MTQSFYRTQIYFFAVHALSFLLAMADDVCCYGCGYIDLHIAPFHQHPCPIPPPFPLRMQIPNHLLPPSLHTREIYGYVISFYYPSLTKTTPNFPATITFAGREPLHAIREWVSSLDFLCL